MCRTTKAPLRSISSSSFNDWGIPDEGLAETDSLNEENMAPEQQSFRPKLGVISAVMATFATLVHHSARNSDVFDLEDQSFFKDESRDIAWVAILLSALPLFLSRGRFWNIVQKVTLAVSEKFRRFKTSRRPHVSVSIDQIESLRKTVSKNSMDAAKRISMAARDSSAAGLSHLTEAVKSFPCWHGSGESAGHHRHVASLSDKEPFVAQELVARMSLRDVTLLLQHANDNRPLAPDCVGESSSPVLKRVQDAIDAAVCVSRGMDVVVDQERDGACSSNGADMDVFAFCAFLRVFAEWRMVRQVPEGYRAYSAGMNMGRHDLIQNIAKLEKASHAWILLQRGISLEDDSSVVVVKSPTLRQLLEHELERDMHPKLPKLSDKTAAISLLWTLRQLQYQAATYANLLQLPSAFPNSSAAGRAAYDEVFASYHGWMIQKVFHHSLQSTPPVDKLYRTMNPQLYKELACSTRSGHDIVHLHLPKLQESTVSSFSSEDDAPFTWEELDQAYEAEGGDHHNICTLGSHLLETWDQAGKNIQGGWDNLVRSTVGLFKNMEHEEQLRQKHARDQYKQRFISDLSRYDFHPERHSHDEPFSPPRHESLLEDDPSFSPLPRCSTSDRDDFVAEGLTKEAHSQINAHLNVMRPLLRDVMELMESLNMNDPSKV